MTRKSCSLARCVAMLTIASSLSYWSANATSEPSERSLEEIVAASLSASGGAALDAVKTWTRRGDMHVESDMFGIVDGSWEIAAELGKRGFQKSVVGPSETTVAWDGENAWEVSMMGMRDFSAIEIWLNRWTWEPSLLHALSREGASLERLPDELISERDHTCLGYTSPEGDVTRIYIDSETQLITRLATTLEMPTGPTAVTTDFSDYAEIEGVMLPGSMHQVIENLWVVDIAFQETEFNVELGSELFERP